MNWILGILILTAIASLIMKSKSRPASSSEVILSYQCKNALLTPAEQRFLKALDSSTDKHIRVFSMVRVADVIIPTKSLNPSDKHKLFRKTSQKHFDFVLCDTSTLKPLCIIELNDKSHQQKKRKERDEFLARACESANLPLHFIQVQRSYDQSFLTNLIKAQQPAALRQAS